VLRQVADGVLVHESEFLQSNAVVVQGKTGLLVVDPGITRGELATIAGDVGGLGQPIVAGFSTHPHWDHLLWHPDLGAAPRYGTGRCAADVRELLSDATWRDRVAEALPPEIADETPLDLFGLITGLPMEAGRIPWDGPSLRIIEHQAHAPGHAAMLIEERGVLVAGDMLSDVLIPMLDLDAADPIGDYVDGLVRLENVAADVAVVIPGHGSVGDAAALRARIAQDRAYVEALRDASGADDPRLDPSAVHGSWLPGLHDWQVQQLAPRPNDATAGGTEASAARGSQDFI